MEGAPPSEWLQKVWRRCVHPNGFDANVGGFNATREALERTERTTEYF